VTVMCLSPEKLLEAHSTSTTWLPLESFLPPSGRNGKVSRLGEICASAVCCKCLGRANRLLRAKIKFHRVITPQCDARDEVVVHRRQAAQSIVHRLRLIPHVSDRGPQTA
jgi:hypothetical protein